MAEDQTLVHLILVQETHLHVTPSQGMNGGSVGGSPGKGGGGGGGFMVVGTTGSGPHPSPGIQLDLVEVFQQQLWSSKWTNTATPTARAPDGFKYFVEVDMVVV